MAEQTVLQRAGLKAAQKAQKMASLKAWTWVVARAVARVGW